MKPQRLMIAAVSLILAGVCAQAAQSRPDPQDAQAAVPPLHYRSSFESYRFFGNEKVGDWKAANDTVGRIGGWKAYAREARETAAPAPGAPDSPRGPAAAAPQPGAAGAAVRHPQH